MSRKKAVALVISSLLACMATIAIPAKAQQASENKAEIVDEETIKDVVKETLQNDKDAMKDADKEKKGAETGEASYNIENCEALLKDAEDGKSVSKGVEKHDLDKCKQLVK